MEKKINKKSSKQLKIKKSQKTKSSPKSKKPIKKSPKRYWQAVGRRKEAVARVRLYTSRLTPRDEGDIEVNNKFYKDYFPLLSWRKTVEAAFNKLKSLNRFKATVRVSGGGLHAQAEAVRHGLSRALVQFNPDFRKKLKRAGFLRRDSRMKERKKYGLKKARRAPQWSKR